MEITYIIWWIGIVVFFAMLWQMAKSLQSIAVSFRKFEELIKKFESFKITETPTPTVAVAAPAPVAVSAAPTASAPAAANGDSIPAEIVAVIAAAVDSVMAGPHRILSINPVGAIGGPNPFQTSLAWAAEGRRGIFESHKLR